MATEKTPKHKRIKRAEQGREDWKVKATERREEIQFLKEELNKKSSQLEEANQLNTNLLEDLKKANIQLAELAQNPLKKRIKPG